MKIDFLAAGQTNFAGFHCQPTPFPFCIAPRVQ